MNYVAISLFDEDSQEIEFIEGLQPGEESIPTLEAAGVRSVAVRETNQPVPSYSVENMVVYSTEFRFVLPEDKFETWKQDLKRKGYQFIRSSVFALRQEWNNIKEFML